MRISAAECKAIVEAIEQFRNNVHCELRLYGSRTDDSKKGRDIDLLIIAENKIGCHNCKC